MNIVWAKYILLQVKELKLNYHNSDTTWLTLYPNTGNENLVP